MKYLLSVILFTLWAGSAMAAIEAYQFDTPEMENDYNELINELRCLVCQNQNLAGSDAELAQDLRRETYDMLRAGKTPDEVIEFMVARYGDFVLYRPQFKSSTYLLWLGPFFLLLLVLIMIFRRYRQSGETVEVSADSLETARRLLDKEDNAK